MKEKAKLVVYRGRGWSLIRLTTSTNLYVVASEKGKPRLYESTGTGNITEAMGRGRDKFKLWQRTTGEPQGRLLISDGWKKMNEAREKLIAVGDLKQSTHTRTVNSWKRLEPFWGGKLPKEITQDNWTDYKAKMNEKYGRPSLQPEFKCLGQVANYMHHEGLAPVPAKVEIGKANAKPLDPRRVIPTEHLKQIWHKTLKQPERVQLFIGNGMCHGMRIEEVTCLEQKNFYKENGIWYLKITKSKTGPRTIQVNKRLIPLFKRIRAQAPHQFFFPQVRGELTKCSPTQTWDRIWRENVRDPLGLDYVFHEFRHTAISNACDADVNPGKVSRYFGVSLDEIDRTYLKLNKGQTGDCADVLRL